MILAARSNLCWTCSCASGVPDIYGGRNLILRYLHWNVAHASLISPLGISSRRPKNNASYLCYGQHMEQQMARRKLVTRCILSHSLRSEMRGEALDGSPPILEDWSPRNHLLAIISWIRREASRRSILHLCCRL
jgi:hypothetical protein